MNKRQALQIVNLVKKDQVRLACKLARTWSTPTYGDLEDNIQLWLSGGPDRIEAEQFFQDLDQDNINRTIELVRDEAKRGYNRREMRRLISYLSNIKAPYKERYPYT